MKRMFFTAAAILIATSAFAQRIVIDKVDSDGWRSIATNEINCRVGMTDRTPMFFALFHVVSPDGDGVYSLHVRTNSVQSFSVPKGAVMLIKLDNDEILELRNDMEESDTEDLIGEPVPGSATMRSYDMHARYEISEEQLDKICNHAVVKIRVENSGNAIDENYKNDKVGEAVRAQYAVISEALSEKKDIYSDF